MFTEFYNNAMIAAQRVRKSTKTEVVHAGLDLDARRLVVAQQAQIEGLQRAVHLLVDELRGSLRSGVGRRITSSMSPIEPVFVSLNLDDEDDELMPKKPVARTWSHRILDWVYELAQADKRESYTKRWTPSERDMFSFRRSAFEIGIGGYGDVVDVTFTTKLHPHANRLRDFLIWKGVEVHITREGDLHRTKVAFADLAKLGCPRADGTVVLPPDDGDDDEDGVGAARDHEDDGPKVRRIGHKAKYPESDFGSEDLAEEAQKEWDDNKRMNWAREFLSGLEVSEDWNVVCRKTKIFKYMVQFMSLEADTQAMHDYLRRKGLTFHQITINGHTYFSVVGLHLINAKFIDAQAFVGAPDKIDLSANADVLTVDGRAHKMQMRQWKTRFLASSTIYDHVEISLNESKTAMLFNIEGDKVYAEVKDLLVKKLLSYSSDHHTNNHFVVRVEASDLISGGHAEPSLFGQQVEAVVKQVEEQSEIADAFMRSIMMVPSYMVEEGTHNAVHAMIHGSGPTFVFWTAKQEDAEHIHHVLREHGVPFGNWFETARGHCIRISVENLRRIVAQTGERETPVPVLPDEEVIDLRHEIDSQWVNIAWRNDREFEFKTTPDAETFAEWSDRVWASAAIRVWAHQVQDITAQNVGACRVFEFAFDSEDLLNEFRAWVQCHTPAGEYEYATINGKSLLRVPNWVLGQAGFAVPVPPHAGLTYDLLVNKATLKMLWAKMNPECGDEQIEASIAAFSKEVN